MEITKPDQIIQRVMHDNTPVISPISHIKYSARRDNVMTDDTNTPSTLKSFTIYFKLQLGKHHPPTLNTVFQSSSKLFVKKKKKLKAT